MGATPGTRSLFTSAKRLPAVARDQSGASVAEGVSSKPLHHRATGCAGADQAEIEAPMKYRAVVFTLSAAALVAVVLISGCGGSSSSNNQVTNPSTEPFESGALAGGDTFVHRFATAGSFGYRCRFHAIMTGTVSVAAGGADSAVISIVSSTVSRALPWGACPSSRLATCGGSTTTAAPPTP
jgi:hypothetical protein